MRTGQWDGQMHVLASTGQQADSRVGTKIIGYAEATAELDFIADELDGRADFLGLGSQDFLRFSRLGH